MRKRLWVFGSVLVLVMGLSSVSFLAQNRTRPTTGNDFKVRYKTSMTSGGAPGNAGESVTMIKGPRERSENHTGYGYDTIEITQCDLKRNIRISDNARKYIITPMETGAASSSTPSTSTPSASGPNKRGGIVTYKTSSIDTGERKEMFGFTARHVKSSTIIESSPDACNQVKQHSELDGWYIDLNVGLDCQLNRPPVMPTAPNVSGRCIDETRFQRTGNGKVGYPLIETMTLYGENGQVSFMTTKEVIELSRQPLDAALFDVPAGYTEAASSQELYGMPSMAAMIAQAQGQSGNTDSPSPSTASGPVAKKPGSILIGVAQLNNKAGRPVALDSLRARLMGQITNAGFEAVALNATSQAEADAEAKAKQCDFIVLTDIAALKMNKLGGMFGQVTGVGGVGKTEAKIEFKLFAVGEGSPRLQSSTSAKEEGDDVSAGLAIDNEAKMITTEVRKKGRG
jgi:hypothetical protein